MKNNIFSGLIAGKNYISNGIHGSYTNRRLVLFILMTALGLAGCGDKDSSGDSIVTSSFVGAEGNCANGGIKIEVSRDGKILSDQTQYVCNGDNGINGSNGLNGLDGLNGENGRNANIQTSTFDGEQGSCMHGGVKVEVLIDGEVQADQTQYICNGTAGQDGIEGQAGQNGHNALAVSSDEVGENCANGGLRIDFGLDANDNDILDDAEILASRYVCNGADGEDGQAGQNGHNALAASSDEVGENCANGGTRLDFGLDANDNDTLDADEILSSRYICNGEDGENSDKAASIQTTSFDGEQGICTNGGVKVEVLIDGEVQADQTQYICNGVNGADGHDGHDGQNGHNTLAATSDDVGSHCANGGIRLDVGLDSNDNATLDTDEILNTRYICNGTDGEDGTDGKNASIQTTAFEGAQGSCTNGGVKVEVFIDGVVQAGQTQYICNGVNGHDGHDGQNGHSALVATSDADIAHCANGGIRVDFGLDTNGNNVLNADEILSTRYVCNGANGDDGTDGKNASIQTTAFEGAQGSCTNGGIKVDILIDGIVQADQTQYVCNGADEEDICGLFQDYVMVLGKCVLKGDIVTFGNYPQATNTPEPIRWIVFDLQPPASAGEKGRALLLSEYVIDTMPYHTTSSYPTWANSNIRAWLNDASSGFIAAAFNATELGSIIEVTNSTSDYTSGSTVYDGGANTKDKVFLLDRVDAENTVYFEDDEARKARATSYVIQKGASVSETCTDVQCTAHWWLRSPGNSTGRAAGVKSNGEVYGGGVGVSDVRGGIRPALWVEY